MFDPERRNIITLRQLPRARWGQLAQQVAMPLIGV
jgi:hypothetical protein